LRPTQSESAYCGNFVDSIDWKHFVDKSRLLQSRKQLLDRCSLVLHFVLFILLKEKLLLELVEIGPEIALVLLYVYSVSFKVINLCQLQFLFFINFLQLLIELCQFIFKGLSLFLFFVVFFPLEQRCLQLQVLFQLEQLLAVSNSLFLFLFDLVVQLLKYLIEAGEADWVLDLEASLFGDIAFNEVSD